MHNGMKTAYENRDRAVIFDMDGLIFDTENLYTEAWIHAGQETGYPITRAFMLNMRGADRTRSERLFRETFGATFPVEKLRSIRTAYVDAHMARHGVPIKKGLIPLLNHLKENRYKVALATSTARETAEKFLKLAGVDLYFDYCIFGDQVANCKPDPEIFIKASKGLGTAPESCFVFEDSIFGVTAAHRAGCKVIMVPDGIEPDRETETYLYAKCESLLEGLEVLRKWE